MLTMEIPEKILPYLGDPELFVDHWPDVPYHQISTAGQLGNLLPWSAIDFLLNDQVLRLPAFRMARDNRKIPTNRLTRSTRATFRAGEDVADPARITHELGNGATLVLQNVHLRWPPLRYLTRRLSAEIGHAVIVNAFLTPKGQQGFGAHFDSQHAWLVQLQGSKKWELWESGKSVSTDKPDYCVDLRAGDVLWIPRGWWHSGRSTDEDSLHLTLAVRATNFEDVCQEAVRLLSKQSALARELPPNALATETEAARTTAYAVREITRALTDLDIGVLADSVVDNSLDWFDALPGRPIADCLGDERDRIYHTHPEGIVHIGVRETIVRVRTVDADLEFSSEKLGIFWSLVNRKSPFSLPSLGMDSSRKEDELLVEQLLEARLLCAAPCPNGAAYW